MPKGIIGLDTKARLSYRLNGELKFQTNNNFFMNFFSPPSGPPTGSCSSLHLKANS
jgi:hypothetical protein